jgi:hypothetical protein
MKKKINIALILIVLTVWGIVASKTLSQYFFLEKNNFNTDKFTPNLTIHKIQKDTFTINPIIRDPFLNTKKRIITTKDLPSKNEYFKKPILEKKVQNEIVKQKEILNWPPISYHGYINSRDRDGELLILVNIDKKLYKLKLNEESEGIILKKFYKDSIQLVFNKEKKIFRIQ